jgi:hypothetical protein
MFKQLMTRMSTKSFTRNIAKLDAQDKKAIGAWSCCIITGSLLTFEILRKDRVDIQIRRDEVLNRRDSTTILHRKD